MDKNAIKKYAVWARNELIARVSQKAQQYGITAAGCGDENADSVDGNLLSATEKKQRQALIKKIKESSFEQVMEEVAYTWFNRFTALRFMEVNNYLPSHTRVFTNESNEFKPQILADAISLDLEGLDMDKVFALKDANKDEELYKYLLIVQCNALNSILPGMFQKIEDYTELLLPDYLLRKGSVLEQMLELIPEEDWTDQVQIIGWLYQYYNIEPKERVFSKPKTDKISKNEIPAATQLFTPDWIVRYMVENSLGRVWINGHNNTSIKDNWKYYIEEVKQEPSVEKQIQEQFQGCGQNPETIKCIDPCSGSGHVLCYMFDVLVQIYEEYGYTSREAVSSIVKNNLWGLDIDHRASQLAYFSVMMKARQYDRRFFSIKDENGLIAIPQPNIMAIEESGYTDCNGKARYYYNEATLDYFTNKNVELEQAINSILNDLFDAREYGSIVRISPVNFQLLYERFAELKDDINIQSYMALNTLFPLVNLAKILCQKYDVVCTNPPYMGSKGGMNDKLKKYISKYYERSKSDLYAVFMDVGYNMCNDHGYLAMINQHGWMFLSSFSKLRNFVVDNTSIINMIHLGTRAFEEISGDVVQTTAFVLSKCKVDYVGKYYRLVDISEANEKEKVFLNIPKEEESIYAFEFPMRYYKYLPDNLIGYWISTKIIDIFNNEKGLAEIAKPRQGLSTSDNDRFLRLWHEVDIHNIGFGFETRDEAAQSGKKWFPYNKGGEYRKWYGNNNYVINWQYDGRELREWADYLNTHGTSMGRLVSQEFYYKKGLTWSGVGATRFGVRCYPSGMLFDVGANGLFVEDELYYYMAGFLHTKLANEMIKVLNPTINTGSGTVGKLPVIIDKDNISTINEYVKECVDIAKAEWDSYETSWDFKKNHLIGKYKLIEDAYNDWKSVSQSRFDRLKDLEEKINEIFISIYGLEKDISPEVSIQDVSIEVIDENRAIKSLISYAVGCMFGRYSLDEEGLVFAGGKWNPQNYRKYLPDMDNIIPICDDEYFNDDIVARFIDFIKEVYGEENLENNLLFIAKSLGGVGSSRDIIRQYFINGFYTDHCTTYSINGSGKRPIYWMLDSGKKGGFKCLIYIHRYSKDLVARIRTDYVHEQQSRYRTIISEMEQRIDKSSSSERIKLTKRLRELKEQLEESIIFEEKVHHLADKMITIDLDDGFKKNYGLFEDVMAKVK